MTEGRSKNGAGIGNLAQHEIVAIATFLLGGDRRPVDMEDIAVKANEIAPGRFSWRRYKDQIDIETIYKRLWESTKQEKGGYITGSRGDGWSMTLAGTKFAERTVPALANLGPSRERRTKKEEDRLRRERNRMRAEVAYEKARDGRFSEVTSLEAERFFRLDDYVVGVVRERKIQQTENAFRDDPDLRPVVTKIAEIVRSKK
jgi:hypothetical protein